MTLALEIALGIALSPVIMVLGLIALVIAIPIAILAGLLFAGYWGYQHGGPLGLLAILLAYTALISGINFLLEPITKKNKKAASVKPSIANEHKKAA